GVDVEIEELDRRTDEACEQDAAWRGGCTHRQSARHWNGRPIMAQDPAGPGSRCAGNRPAARIALSLPPPSPAVAPAMPHLIARTGTARAAAPSRPVPRTT